MRLFRYSAVPIIIIIKYDQELLLITVFWCSSGTHHHLMKSQSCASCHDRSSKWAGMSQPSPKQLWSHDQANRNTCPWPPNVLLASRGFDSLIHTEKCHYRQPHVRLGCGSGPVCTRSDRPLCSNCIMQFSLARLTWVLSLWDGVWHHSLVNEMNLFLLFTETASSSAELECRCADCCIRLHQSICFVASVFSLLYEVMLWNWAWI